MRDDGELLLAAIRAHPLEATPRLAYLDWCQEHPGAVRSMIERAMRAEAALTVDGICGFPLPRWYSLECAAAFYERQRRALLDCGEAFAASTAWLAPRGRTRWVDRGNSADGYRRRVEESFRDLGRPLRVPEGAFVAAAIAAGFAWHYSPLHDAVRVGISRRRPRPAIVTATGPPAAFPAPVPASALQEA